MISFVFDCSQQRKKCSEFSTHVEINWIDLGCTKIIQLKHYVVSESWDFFGSLGGKSLYSKYVTIWKVVQEEKNLTHFITELKLQRGKVMNWTKVSVHFKTWDHYLSTELQPLFQIATSICSGATTGLKMKQIKWKCQRSVHFQRWRSWRRCFCNGMRMSILVQLFFGQLYVDVQIVADIRQSWQWHVYILFWRQREGWKFHQNWVKGHYSKHPLRLFRDFMNHKTFFNDFRIYETHCKGEPSTTF